MDFIKFIVESYVELVHYVAWPGVALLALFLFRKEFGLLMGRIRRFERSRHGDIICDWSKQGEAGILPVSEPSPETEKPAELSKDATRILATLWQRQKHHFKDDFTGRWSFRVLPNAYEYGAFMLGFAELLKLGLVGWTRKDGQALLTDKGVEYLKEHPEIQESDDVYRF